MTALEGDEQRAVFMSDVERRMSGDRVTGSGDSFADVERRVPLLEMIQARTEGRELTGAAAEYAQETERRTGRKAEGVCADGRFRDPRRTDHEHGGGHRSRGLPR